MRGRKKSGQKVAPHAGKRARNAPLERGANAAAVGGVKEKCKEKHFSLAYAAQGCYYRAKSVERELCR